MTPTTAAMFLACFVLKLALLLWIKANIITSAYCVYDGSLLTCEECIIREYSKYFQYFNVTKYNKCKNSMLKCAKSCFSYYFLNDTYVDTPTYIP